MIAREIMGRVKAPMRSANCKDVAMKLMSLEYSSLPVVDEEGIVVGIISEFDILKALRSGTDLSASTAGDVMSLDPICVDEDTPVDDIIDTMTTRHLLRVPVVREGRLMGTISRRNILDSQLSIWGDYWVLKDSD